MTHTHTHTHTHAHTHTRTHTHTRARTLRTSIWNALYMCHLLVLLPSKLDDLHTVLSPAGMKMGDQWPPGNKGDLGLRRADPEAGEVRKDNGRDSLEGPRSRGMLVWDCRLLSCSIHFREGDFFSHGLPMELSWSRILLQCCRRPPVQFLGWEDPLEKGTATHSSILAWRIPRTVCIVHGVAKAGHD